MRCAVCITSGIQRITWLQFEKAVALTGAEFDDALRYSIESWLPGRALVEEAMDKAATVHDSGASPHATRVSEPLGTV